MSGQYLNTITPQDIKKDAHTPVFLHRPEEATDIQFYLRTSVQQASLSPAAAVLIIL